MGKNLLECYYSISVVKYKPTADNCVVKTVTIKLSAAHPDTAVCAILLRSAWPLWIRKNDTRRRPMEGSILRAGNRHKMKMVNKHVAMDMWQSPRIGKDGAKRRSRCRDKNIGGYISTVLTQRPQINRKSLLRIMKSARAIRHGWPI